MSRWANSATFRTLASEFNFYTRGAIRNLLGAGLAVFDNEARTVVTLTLMGPDHWT